MFACARDWAQARKYDEIVSFSDNRLTTGDVYSQLGFERNQAYGPDYFYVKDGHRVSKQSQRKSHTACPLGMTEWEWARTRGLRRVLDAGKVRWVVCLNVEARALKRQANSERTAQRHAAGMFKHAHVRGYFKSAKNAGEVYFGSSYELRCLFELEEDANVKAMQRCEAFQAFGGNWRNPDLRVTFVDGHSEIWEVKPFAFLEQPAVQAQIADTMAYASGLGVPVRVWTERNSTLGGERQIMAWARAYLSEQQGDESYEERQKVMRKALRERHYKKEQAASVTVHCAYCGKDHVVLPRTYARNIARHDGVYVCEAMAGSIGGRKPKDHLKKTNPYAAEGKKQCSRCGQVVPMEQFDRRTKSWDGLGSACKTCMSAINADRYQARKKSKVSLG
jgi:hypothetical protein